METSRQVLGRRGEQEAAERALSRGYAVIDRNYRTPYGEIDLILRSPENEIVFVEVKARTGTFFGYPESAVNKRKKSHILRSAYYYLRRTFPDNDEIPWHVDIMALIYKKDQQTLVDFRWFEDVTADE